MAAKYGYIGNNPADSSVFVARQTFSPSGITTTFTFASGYTIGYLDAYLNGSRLIEGQDYVATNGSTIDLVSSATGGDVLELLAYKAFNTVALTHAPGNFEVAGDFTVQGNSFLAVSNGIGTVTIVIGSTALFVDGNARIVGILTIGSSSITLNGSTNTINVGAGLTFDGNTGIVSASQVFAGGVNLANVASGNITPTSIAISDQGVNVVTINSSGITGGAATFTNLTVNGTQTIINTTSLEISDKNIGIGSTSTPSDSYADGAGITIYGTTNKTLTWNNSNSRLAFNTDVYAPRYFGDGSGLQGVVSGIAISEGGESRGSSITTLNFSGATITQASGGISTITISGGGGGSISTEALTASGITTTLDLSKQDHKVTASGITTITCSGGTEGESHTVRIVNSGIATVGFSTFFLFPSGSVPSLPTTSGTINLISFTVHRVGAAGTQLLAGAGLNYQ